MTTAALARLVRRSPHWVRGAIAAYGMKRRRYGRAYVIDAADCERIVRLARSERRLLAVNASN